MSSLAAFEKYMNAVQVGKVVDFDASKDTLLPLDLTASNTALTEDVLADTDAFSAWVKNALEHAGARYAIGGYDEHRTIYSRSSHFDAAGNEPRRLHLGVDIWGPAGTAVYNFADASVYGFANNNNFGDYGATIILRYDLDGVIVYGLYGHLSHASLDGLYEGKLIASGEKFATFGIAEENGWWPPHLHFQLMFAMQGNTSDYPGVCKFSERAQYLENCPDPMHVLRYSF